MMAQMAAAGRAPACGDAGPHKMQRRKRPIREVSSPLLPRHHLHRPSINCSTPAASAPPSSGVPVRVVDDHAVGAGEVDAQPADLRREQGDERAVLVELVDHRQPLRDLRRPVDADVRVAAPPQQGPRQTRACWGARELTNKFDPGQKPGSNDFDPG